MPKRPRFKGTKLYHHIYNRGNDRHPIFKVRSDYKRYLRKLFEYGLKHRIDIIAYALMEWHLHLFIFDRDGKISKFMNVLHGQYAQVFNKIHGKIGHVFEGRFKNKIVDVNNYGIWLSRYIHRQPVEAGLVSLPEEYEWTSYRTYIGMFKNQLLKPEVILSQFGKKSEERNSAYKDFVEGEESGPADWDTIEKSGQPIVGNDEFINELNITLDTDSVEHRTIDNILEQICFRLNISRNLLKKPQGQLEKKIRHKAITILESEYNMGVREIARIFDISPGLVSHVLKNNLKNNFQN
jgi:putative transposase